jgi:hypothetical protein
MSLYDCPNAYAVEELLDRLRRVLRSRLSLSDMQFILDTVGVVPLNNTTDAIEQLLIVLQK